MRTWSASRMNALTPRAPGERRHEARALLLGPEGEDRQRCRARVHGDGDTDAGVGARELLQHEDVAEEVGAGAAVFVGDAGPHEPELGELREDLARKVV